MANTTYEQVLRSFESTFQNKYVLPEELVYQWFIDSLGEFSLEVEVLNFDETQREFDRDLDQWIIRSLALMMKIKYCTREVSRINKLNNIIGKDVSFNATGDTKKYTRAELLNEINTLQDLLQKQKPTAYI